MGMKDEDDAKRKTTPKTNKQEKIFSSLRSTENSHKFSAFSPRPRAPLGNETNVFGHRSWRRHQFIKVESNKGMFMSLKGALSPQPTAILRFKAPHWSRFGNLSS
jgi:hypothetical protein